MGAFLLLGITGRCRSPPVLTSFQIQLILEMEVRTMTDKEDKTVRQFVLFCRTALMYEKKNYYNEQKHRGRTRNTYRDAFIKTVRHG